MAAIPDEKTLVVDWPRHSSKSFHCENCFTLDARREMQEGPPQDHVATESGERNQGDGEMEKTCGGIKLMARDRQMWREHVAALHAT